MRVRVNETIEVSDEQLVMMADLADQKTSKRKAKRDEARAFIWASGEDWPLTLTDTWQEKFGPDEDDLI